MRYDYVIIGAGSAGCVLANRLSADPNNNVLLLEAGKTDKNAAIYTPLGVIIAMVGGLRNWCFNSAPQTELNGRSVFCPRGKTLGGSSSINAMLYIRGQKQDYDDWAAQGNRGWSYNEVLPFFKKSQHQERGESPLHGVGGPLNVADRRSAHPLNQSQIEAAIQCGERRNDDFNGVEQEGVGWYQVTQKDGQRCSAAAAYLHPVLNHRPNLTVLTEAQSSRIVLNGKRAVGVEFNHQGQTKTAFANNEVLLSAGAFGSPQLLLLSGIGATDKLAPHGIETRHELAGVGENLQEHVDVLVVAKDKTATSWATLRPLQIVRSLGEIFRYWRSRKGMLASTVAEAGGFVRSDEQVATPDLQLHFTPLAMDDHGRNLKLWTKYGISCHVCLLRPESRGQVSLASADPKAYPIIDLNVLSHPNDLKAMIKGVRKVREYLRAPALAHSYSGEIFPGETVQSDEQITEFLREKASHIYHPVGTCKMGQDPMAVVDDQLRVHGLEGLRVVDASVMPNVISGNTNAPAIMIGEKAAAMIIEAQNGSESEAKSEPVPQIKHSVEEAVAEEA